MDTEKKLNLKPLLISAVLLLIACVSFFLLARWASSNAVFEEIHASVDQKTQRVLGLSASSAAISTGISLLPGDAGTPIAEKIADLTSDFLLILCVLYTEKNLLAVIGSVVFRYAIPIACGLLIWYQFQNKEILRTLAVKLIVLGLAVFMAIPISLKVSDAIYENHKEIVEMTAEEAEKLNETTSQLTEADEAQNPIAAVLNRLKETSSGLVNKGAQMLNHFIESIAIFIVTTCVMPLLVLVLILWLVNKLTGISIDYTRFRRRRL